MSNCHVRHGRKKKLKIERNTTSLSPKNVWGKIVLYLKEHKKISLYVACGDITDVKIDDKKLAIKTSDDFLISVLEDGKRELENALRWQGLNLEVEIIKFESVDQMRDKDILKLSKLFGEKLILE